MEANKTRIKEIDDLFGGSFPPLLKENRTLIGEGSLTKVCRRKSKSRKFFLFNDILVYCKYVWKGTRLASQHVLPLEDIEVEESPDTDILEHGFIIKSPQKSFVVYAATNDERDQWMRHITNCVNQRVHANKRKQPALKSPVWVPDDATDVCMICKIYNFNFINRKHHCRKCGKIVCEKCSQKRFLIPEISSVTVRVCDLCYFVLSQIQ